MNIVEIKDEWITLGQFLKLTDCIATGGHAKHFIQETTIKVNGERETRRGKKLKHLDQIEVEGFGHFEVRQKF